MSVSTVKALPLRATAARTNEQKRRVILFFIAVIFFSSGAEVRAVIG